MKHSWKITTIFTLALALLLPASRALATAPANSTITNRATLSYSGLATPLEATVDVSVTLKPQPPTLSAPADNTVAENQPSAASYRITSNANGPDSYDLGAAASVSNLTGTSAVKYYQGAMEITAVALGATAPSIGPAAGDTTLTVPSDGSADTEVNGISGTDTVTIAGEDYTVQSVVDDGATATITLTGGLAADIGIGELIREYQLFDMKLADIGAIDPATPAYTDITTTASSNADASKSVSDLHRTNVVEITFAKYVRNDTNANGDAAKMITLNGQEYYLSDANVAAAPGDTLEYALVVTTTNAGVSSAVLTDAVPTFTSYVAGSTRLNGIAVAGDGAASPLAGGLAVDDDTGRAAGAAATGTIGAGKTVIVTCRVTVDN